MSTRFSEVASVVNDIASGARVRGFVVFLLNTAPLLYEINPFFSPVIYR